jgi:hypothetical protein
VPGAAHRALRNATLTRWEAAGAPAAPHRPGEGDVVATDRNGVPHRRYEDLMPLPGMTGDLEEMAMYAGQSVGLVGDTRDRPATSSGHSRRRPREVIAGLQ